MVKPTGTSDALVSGNRFAIFGSATFDNQIPPTLSDETGMAADGATALPNNTKGAISKTRTVNAKASERQNRLIPGLHLHSGKQGKQIRDRSSSTKRKNSGESEAVAKTPRMDASECPHLKTINENRSVISKVMTSMAEYSGEDTVIAENIRSLSLCVNSINEILGTVMAERLIPGNSPDVVICEETQVSVGTDQTNFPFPSNNNNRKPLQQQPLGNTESWVTAVSRNKKKEQQVRKQHDQRDSAQGEQVNTPAPREPESAFNKAVKEAERSILVFNLDMGQTPIMNPATISAKVTLSMLNILADKEKTQQGNHSQAARDFIDDIMSQVVRMEFFGSKTGPCKFPNDKSLNGKFFTVPVKMVFKDRRTAQTAADLLRTHMGIHSTTPYHKSLRAAINQAIAKAKEGNPGHHAKVNVDMNGRTLKVFIRPDTKPPGSWTPLGKNIPIPAAALDPGTRDLTKVVLPTSPNCPSLKSMHRRTAQENSASNKAQGSEADQPETTRNSGYLEKDPGYLDWASEDPSAEVIQKMQEDVNATLSPLPAFMNTPKNKGNGSNMPLGRSNLVLRTPPGSDKDRRSSFGS